MVVLNYELNVLKYDVSKNGSRQGRSQPHSPGWAIYYFLFTHFPQMFNNFSYFPSNFPHFCPHFGLPSGQPNERTHPGKHNAPLGTFWSQYSHHLQFNQTGPGPLTNMVYVYMRLSLQGRHEIVLLMFCFTVHSILPRSTSSGFW